MVTQLWSINLPQRGKKYTMGKRESFQQVTWKIWTVTHTSMKSEHTIHKNKLKMA